MKPISVRFLPFMLLAFLFNITQPACAQQTVASPAQTTKGKIGGADVTINYGSPAVKGRQVFGGLEPYGKVWRSGANAATTFETTKDLQVEGQTLPAGKYAFFTIPGQEEWTVIFNKEPNQWGAYKYDQSKDALRVTVKPRKSEFNERLVYLVTENGIALRWADVEVPVAIK